MKRQAVARHPEPEQIRALREQLEMTQTEAAAVAESSLRTWAAWEGGESKMHPAIWNWFQHEAKRLQPIRQHDRRQAAAKHR